MWSWQFNDENFNVRDGVCAIVTGCCRTGLFLELENGQEAFASFGRLELGTKVFCSVLKKATEKWRVLVSIDGIYEKALTA